MNALPQAPQLSRTLAAHVALYGKSHQNPVNQEFHFVGIPLMMVSGLGLLSKAVRMRKGLLSAGVTALAAGMLYARWDRRAALRLAATAAACELAGQRWSTATLLTMFGAGAAMHMVGHYGFEHKPPAFLSRPVAILEAPAWLLCKKVTDCCS
jgi:uncharacterized membrane protein YGL010W